MSSDKKEVILRRVGSKRRDFLKGVLGGAGAVFAMPLMASFSIDSLYASAAPAPVLTSGYGYCSSAPALEYDGPDGFEAHFSDPNLATRINGEVTFEISAPGHENGNGNDGNGNGDDHSHPAQTTRINTNLTISRGSFLSSASIYVDNQPVVNFLSGQSTVSIFPSTPLSYVCDFNALLEAMAADRAKVVVTAAYPGPSGPYYTLVGPIKSVLRDTIRVLPN